METTGTTQKSPVLAVYKIHQMSLSITTKRLIQIKTSKLPKMVIFGAFVTVLAPAIASSLTPPTSIGIIFEPSHDLPLLKLPYGTWRAHEYNSEEDVISPSLSSPPLLD
jgi:hypothetical protein